MKNRKENAMVKITETGPQGTKSYTVKWGDRFEYVVPVEIDLDIWGEVTKIRRQMMISVEFCG